MIAQPRKTVKQLAASLGRSERQLRRDYQFTLAVDRITEIVGPEAQEFILSGRATTISGIVHLAQEPDHVIAATMASLMAGTITSLRRKSGQNVRRVDRLKEQIGKLSAADRAELVAWLEGVE